MARYLLTNITYDFVIFVIVKNICITINIISIFGKNLFSKNILDILYNPNSIFLILFIYLFYLVILLIYFIYKFYLFIFYIIFYLNIFEI